MTADIAGMEWVTIGQVAEEIARQLSVGVLFGRSKGEELLVDPKNLLRHWRPTLSLSEGISLVIADARAFLEQEPHAAGSLAQNIHARAEARNCPPFGAGKS